MYEIVTHDGKVYQIANTDKDKLARLAKALELVPVTLTNGTVEYFAKGNVARLQKSRVTTAVPTDTLIAPTIANNREEPGEGYKSFRNKREQLLNRTY